MNPLLENYQRDGLMLNTPTYYRDIYWGKASSPASSIIKNILGLSGMLVVLLLALGQQVSYAQTASGLSLDPLKAITQYHHQTWNIADGLPQSYVNDIEQTTEGYIWITTQEGLARFDGIRFTVFDVTNEEAFLVNNLNKLHADQNGALWITTSGGGLLAYTAGRFVSYTEEDGLGGNSITSFYEDHEGSFWIGSIPGGLNRLSAGTITTFGQEEGLPGQFVLAVNEDSEQNLWIGTNAGLYRFEDNRFFPSPHNVLAQGFISLIYTDRNGAMWTATRDGGLFQVTGDDIVDLSTALPELDGYITAAIQDAEGGLWFGGIGGLFRLRDGVFESFTEEKGLVNKSVISLFEDRDGNLLVGTKNGLVQIQDGSFTPYTKLEGLIHDDVKSIYEDRDGAIWFGTYGGVNRLQNGRITTITSEQGLASDMVLSVHGDASGAIWIGTAGAGLDRLKDGVFTHFTTEDGLGGNTIYALYPDSRGNLWIATDAGVNRYDGRTFELMRADHGLSSDFPTAFYEGKDGSIWIGMYDAGINRILDGEITVYTSEDGLASDGVLSLYEDEDGVLWIGHKEGGLSRWEDGTFTTYAVREGLFNNTVMTILEADGNLWMSCNKGIFRVAKTEMNAFARGERDLISSTVYGVEDGMKSAEGNGGQQPAGWKARDGSLWFTTTRGAVNIHPAHITHNYLSPTVVIEGLTADNKPVPLEGTIKLPAGSDKLEFEYTALSFVHSDKVRFKYMLEGQDSDWFDAGSKRVAHYTNLKPGTYTLRVIAANNDGVWNTTGASISFELVPFFYQTRWFFFACIASLLVLLIGIHRLRIARLKVRERQLEQTVNERTRDLRREKEKTEKAKDVIEAQADKLRELDHFKTQFFANISHEFRTPLTLIIGPLENALSGAMGPLTDEVRSQLEIMLRNTLRFIRLINQLLDLAKLESGKMALKARPRNLARLVEGIVYSFTAFTEQKGISLSVSSPSGGIDLYYEPDKLEKVLFNLLSNAVKFTPENGEIKVSIIEGPAADGAPEGTVEIHVRDSGPGILAAKLPHIFDRFHQVDDANSRKYEGSGIGLSMVQELVNLHKGSITVESEVGVGSNFIVCLKKGSAHFRRDQIVEQMYDKDDENIDYGGLLELAGSAFDQLEQKNRSKQNNTNTPVASDDAPLVLIVDDNPDICDYVGTCLAGSYRIVSAGDGLEGVEKTRSFRPDVVICDIMMPKLDGFGLCKQIKADKTLNHIPVILLSAKTSQESIIESLENGADEYLSKPFNARELLARLDNMMKLREQERKLQDLNEHLEQKVKDQLDILISERQEYEERLISEKEKAEEASRLKSSILSNMSHEFRTPLTTILGYAEILSAEVPDDLSEFVGYIHDGGLRLMNTLNVILDLACFESSTVQSDTSYINLNRAFEKSLDLWTAAAQKKGIQFQWNLPDEDVWIFSDEAILNRIVNILVENAIKFTENGKVITTVLHNDSETRINVRDTGIGISASYLPHIFDDFMQESLGNDRDFEGNGLSLSLAKRLIDLLGGSITVESTKNVGSVFSIILPQSSSEKRLTGDGSPISVDRVSIKKNRIR